MSQATFGIDITANDKTARGRKQAERSMSQLPKTIGTLNRRQAEQDERRVGGSGRRMIRTFGEVEKAAARALGGRSITGGLSERIGGIRSAASALGSGLGEASAGAGVLEGALGGVGVAAAGTIGILAAGAYAAFKLADGWAKGAASIGRTAEIIGVGTKTLQEFTLAAERAGVDRGTAGSAVGGLSQTLNDARYGRNNDALALLARMGISLKTKSDGTVDVDAMLPQIADAIGRQNSSGRRTAARLLGIPESALPAFTQGGKALAADMTDAGKRGAVIDDEGIAKGKRLARRDTIGAQMLERATNAGKEALADGVDTVGTAVISSARSMTRSSSTNERAADKMERAAGQIEQAVTGARSAGRYSARQIGSFAQRALAVKAEALRYGFSDAEAAGVAANVIMESGGRTHAKELGGGSGRGLIQWTDAPRKAKFREVMGVDVEHASRDQQWRFLRWETQNTEARGWKKALSRGQNPESIAAGFAAHVERPANIPRDSAERAAVAAAMSNIPAIPVHVMVEHRNAPPGTRTTVKAGAGRSPAVSHAFEPVHGG